MNRALLPEMLHCMNNNSAPGNFAGNCTDMTVLERQRDRMKWQHDQIHQQQNQNLNQNQQSYFSGSELISEVFSSATHQAADVQGGFQGLVLGCESMLDGQTVTTRSVKPDPGLENGWPELGKCTEMPNLGCGSLVNGNHGFQMNNSAISRTASCPPAVPAANTTDIKAKEAVLHEKLSSAAGKDSFKKRKADKIPNTKVGVEDDTKEKRIKGNAEEGESKITEQNSTKNNNSNNRESSADTSKENSKANSEVQKPDYIHVRARRGQATDSHSLAERVRREKISERMKYLQDLVPGCNKITSKAGMLDEIINYVQSLQRQVEFLSMKLAAVNPRLDFNNDDLFAKEMFPACSAGFQPIGMSSEMTNSAYLQFNPSQQLVSCCGMEVGANNNSPDLGLRRTISAPVSIPELFLDTSCFTVISS
ncbi:hypothetical protein FEM48_Zijuj09G0103300 [Ziziphus jujuba var. spinosa]|uniref:BHLH domain-containing protein n=1 Tax=Ziziphus jujuba var. spinosa TaxID=714518 RepID=A0A978USF6_ZIZJJ|nr:hypothetical protein FEM48_Zijuj09G0103300 [Ziziphus jujuba var. spinosa]